MTEMNCLRLLRRVEEHTDRALKERDKLKSRLDSLSNHLLPNGDRIDLTDTAAVDKLSREHDSAFAEIRRLRRRKTRI